MLSPFPLPPIAVIPLVPGLSPSLMPLPPATGAGEGGGVRVGAPLPLLAPVQALGQPNAFDSTFAQAAVPPLWTRLPAPQPQPQPLCPQPQPQCPQPQPMPSASAITRGSPMAPPHPGTPAAAPGPVPRPAAPPVTLSSPPGPATASEEGAAGHPPIAIVVRRAPSPEPRARRDLLGLHGTAQPRRRSMPTPDLRTALTPERATRDDAPQESRTAASDVPSPVDRDECRWSPAHAPAQTKGRRPPPPLLWLPLTPRRHSDAGLSPGPSDEGDSSDSEGPAPPRRSSADDAWAEKMKASRGKFRGLRGCGTLAGIQMTKGPSDGPGFGAGRGRPTVAA